MTSSRISLDLLMRILAGILGILIVITFIGCGGSSGTTILPPVQEVEYEYRLILMDHIYGGEIDTEIKVPKEEETWYWVRLEYRQVDTTMPWSVVTEGFTLNVTILGHPSGLWMPDLGLTGGQFRVKAAEYRLEFQPPTNAHLGTAIIKLSVPEVGAEVSITVIVVDNQSADPPPSPTCRESHPTREAIDGFWWDCIGGTWSNTGEPVDDPLPPEEEYELRAFPPSSTLELGEGEMFSFKIWDTKAVAFVADVDGSELLDWVVDPIYPDEEYCISTPGAFVTWLDSGSPDYNVLSFITPDVYVVTATYVYKGVELRKDIVVEVGYMS